MLSWCVYSFKCLLVEVVSLVWVSLVLLGSLGPILSGSLVSPTFLISLGLLISLFHLPHCIQQLLCFYQFHKYHIDCTHLARRPSYPQLLWIVLCCFCCLSFSFVVSHYPWFSFSVVNISSFSRQRRHLSAWYWGQAVGKVDIVSN